jgi:hypothetical protein
LFLPWLVGAAKTTSIEATILVDQTVRRIYVF